MSTPGVRDAPGLRERKKQKTRWAIQEHALRLFVRQGYDATTVEQIAAAADISPSTFFRYFKTKEDVVVDDQWDPVIIDLYRSAPVELGPFAALRHALSITMSQVDEVELDKIHARMRLQITVPALRARTLDGVLASLDMIRGMLAERAGRQADDLAVRTAAGAVIGAFLAALLTWQERGAGNDLFECMDQAMEHLSALRFD